VAAEPNDRLHTMDLPLSSVIMQPTTLCNLNCSYCYLPDRRHVHRMSPAVAQKVAASIAPWTDRTTVEVCWHGGEPLTAGRPYLERPMDHFAGLDVMHGVQTNATLIDEEWADFLAKRGVRVGVSIDGPLEDNQQRADWAGRSAFARIIRGIRLLVTREIIVSVIAVVSNPTPERARKLYTFVAELGATWLGVNIEEMEGSNKRRTAPPESQVTDFWAALIEIWHANPTVQLREADRALSYAREVLDEPNGASEHRSCRTTRDHSPTGYATMTPASVSYSRTIGVAPPTNGTTGQCGIIGTRDQKGLLIIGRRGTIGTTKDDSSEL
jgi:uncharacterized protein